MNLNYRGSPTTLLELTSTVVTGSAEQWKTERNLKAWATAQKREEPLIVGNRIPGANILGKLRSQPSSRILFMSLVILFIRFPLIFGISPVTVGSGAGWIVWTAAPLVLSH